MGKNQNLREGEKKHCRKTNIEPITRKVNEGDHRTNIGQNSGKINQGNEINKTFDLYLKKLMGETKKKQRMHS